MVSYRVSTNTDNRNVITRGKTEKEQQINKKQRKMHQFRLLALKQEFLNTSASLQTAFAVETHLSE
jgi:hypothetical protein